MVPLIIKSWDIDENEATTLAVEQWNDMPDLQKRKYGQKDQQQHLQNFYKPTNTTEPFV